MYTKAQLKLKKQLIKAVHVSKRYVNFFRENESEYRELLKKHFGVESSTKLTIEQLMMLIDYLNFKRDSLPIFNQNPQKATARQIEHLRGLWNRYAKDKSERALLWFLKRFEGVLPLRVEYVSKESAQKAIVALKKSLRGKDGC
ncbi:phage protein GemA/Gp16 family protein [Hydrogenimonas thermophila]|uniref:regulatory protein GemA n=1 Tax=Hydrogenimonas thermophila TaxID=223786 RepID=UPI002936E5F6|nr:phage protein GemA/Gp16 family protein [Hydrogenimonas thermophila]WOE69113.1 phage protein GemA/Gp16 family protein [Hydrogenimonas thermophila]WOE71623.1 phage protein GemA/Gp16 family protein [Hydrogenimonas thermophila]